MIRKDLDWYSLRGSRGNTAFGLDLLGFETCTLREAVLDGTVNRGGLIIGIESGNQDEGRVTVGCKETLSALT